MKNSADKQLREKLTGTEFPFDPQAWEQMEAMLDKKKKRGIFFWWWTGGIAAVLLLAIGTLGWGVYLMDEDDRSGEESYKVESGNYEVKNPSASVESGIKQVSSGSKQVEAEAKTKATSAKSEMRQVGSGNTQENSEGTVIAEANGNSKEEKVKSRKDKAQARAVAMMVAKKDASSNKQSSKIRVNPSHPRHLRANGFSENQEAKLLALSLSTQASASAENIYLERREASLLEASLKEEENSFDKTQENVLPKQKKKVFSYSLGVLANVSGSTVGKQQENSFFSKQPSYMVGLTHDFLFVNRIAISNSILFAQTSFKVYQPKTVSFLNTPLDYTSNITELAIPIGIKVYPVAKNNFRFYIGAGIINHIKLKETFEYNMPVDTPNPFTAVADLSTIPPMQTDFNGNGLPYEKYATNGLTSTEYVNTNDFSINSAKRYYASFYASMGVEYIAKKHWIVFAEPMFDMSLQKIGVQDKRKYNLGLSGGLRYQF